MSASIAFILNFVISEWTLAALEELPLAVFQSSDFFFFSFSAAGLSIDLVT